MIDSWMATLATARTMARCFQTLPRLTVGVVSSSPRFVGTISLDVSTVVPGGDTSIVTDAYGALADPRTIQLRLEEPTPSDRAMYEELSSAP